MELSLLWLMAMDRARYYNSNVSVTCIYNRWIQIQCLHPWCHPIVIHLGGYNKLNPSTIDTVSDRSNLTEKSTRNAFLERSN